VVHLPIPILMTVAAPDPAITGPMITGRRGAALERVRLVVLNDEPAAGIRPKGAKVWRSSV
jgi:hypothetical protein